MAPANISLERSSKNCLTKKDSTNSLENISDGIVKQSIASKFMKMPVKTQ
jgi:hypothetical protein